MPARPPRGLSSDSGSLTRSRAKLDPDKPSVVGDNIDRDKRCEPGVDDSSLVSSLTSPKAKATHDMHRAGISGLELYHSTHSTCAQKVRIALAEKDLAWTGHHLDLRGFEHLTPQFLALNPAGFVPVLIDAGHVLTESRLINEYLEDAYPAIPLTPADPFARARMRAWTRYSDEVLTHAIKLPSFAKNIVPGLQSMDPADAAAMIARIPNPAVRARWMRAATHGITADELGPSIAQLTEMARRMDAALAQGPWLAGASYSLADIDVAPFVQRLVRIDCFHLVESCSRLADWYARITARPAYRKAMPVAGSEGIKAGDPTSAN